LPKIEPASSRRAARAFSLAACLIFIALPCAVVAQTAPEASSFARVNTFGFLAAYSNDSSHILMGTAERRKLLDFGASYSRRLILNRKIDWQYDAELLPVALESDPLSRIVVQQISPPAATTVSNGPPLTTCAPYTYHYSFTGPKGVTYSGTYTYTCHGRQWTIGESMLPAGFQWNFRPRHALQPFLVAHGGYIYSTHPIPLSTAGSFNFAFDAGAGFELYQSKGRSIRAGARFHHISNADTSNFNPGIDNVLLQVTFAFGR
jgi:hypothetical protein